MHPPEASPYMRMRYTLGLLTNNGAGGSERAVKPCGMVKAAAKTRLFRAPGRVTLMGDHTDYNDGFALAIGIDRDATVTMRPRSDRIVYARGPDFVREIDLDAEPDPHAGHADIEGIARILDDRKRLRGADLTIESTIATHAGLGSSAAVEMATALALAAAADLELSKWEAAQVGQRANHAFAGFRSGITDHLICMAAVAGHAVLIDARLFEFEPIRWQLGDAAVVVFDGVLKHVDATHATANDRRRECEDAVLILRRELPGLVSLRDLDGLTFARVGVILPDVLRRRVRYVLGENVRVREAADALRASEPARIGTLMAESHRSLRDDYEIGTPEIDALVGRALELDGVYGARMAGASIMVALIRERSVARVAKHLGDAYKRLSGRTLVTYRVAAGAGASEVQ
jgi:galactokinase